MHVYHISRLYQKPASTWERILKEINEKREFLPKQYSPLRNAIVAEIQNAGAGRQLLESGLAAMSEQRNHDTICEKSRTALTNFIAQIRPQISYLHQNYLDPGYTAPPVTFEAHGVKGRLHACAITTNGERAYLYLHPSEWSKDETEAFIELLAIIGEIRHGCPREQIWFVDLQKGEIIKPKQSFKKIRQRLKDTMNLLARLVSTSNDDLSFDFD
jgi:hypothetical protein